MVGAGIWNGWGGFGALSSGMTLELWFISSVSAMSKSSSFANPANEGKPPDRRKPEGGTYISIPCLIALRKHSVFYKLKICDNLVPSRSIGIIFPTAFAHLVSLSHFANSFSI